METIVSIVLMLHSINRWLVVLAALVAIVAYAMTWLTNAPLGQTRRWMSIFTGLLDLQFLLGIIVLVGMGAYPRYQLEHAITMVIAIFIAHAGARRPATSAALSARNYLIAIVVSLILIIIGVTRLPQGWFG